MLIEQDKMCSYFSSCILVYFCDEEDCFPISDPKQDNIAVSIQSACYI